MSKRIIILRAILIFISLVSLSLYSCSTEGCRDPDAINFDPEANADGPCRYTKVIFYAPSDRIGGIADRVVKIEIFRGPTPGQELIGTITTFDQASPSGCVAPAGAFEYELPGASIDYLFLTKYYFDNDTNENGDTYSLRASSTQECLEIELTL